MVETNAFAEARRAIKVTKLVAAITIDAVIAGESFLSAAFAEKLSDAGADFWIAASEKAGCAEPSPITIAAVVAFFYRCAAKANAARPTQAKGVA